VPRSAWQKRQVRYTVPEIRQPGAGNRNGRTGDGGACRAAELPTADGRRAPAAHADGSGRGSGLRAAGRRTEEWMRATPPSHAPGPERRGSRGGAEARRTPDQGVRVVERRTTWEGGRRDGLRRRAGIWYGSGERRGVSWCSGGPPRRDRCAGPFIDSDPMNDPLNGRAAIRPVQRL
jgi:hypothetical protein